MEQIRKLFLLLLSVFFISQFTHANDTEKRYGQNKEVVRIQQVNPTTLDVIFSNNHRMTFDFYADNIFRVFQDNSGGILRAPEANPEAQILVDNPRKVISLLDFSDNGTEIIITTNKIEILIDKNSSKIKIINRITNKVAVEEVESVNFERDRVIQTFKENADEYFFGGGVQNGRFSHKGMAIAIENQNSWTDGGVASPTPFYWSTKGYGVMWYTFKKGKYDFGAKEKGLVKIYHESDYLDVFFMINDGVVPLLNDFYQLTGHPILIPKFGFYQGHLNAYNRDYWLEDEKGILFEDGKRYKESQKNNDGIKESLNGEFNNYQFSARAVIDRYKANDMPLGWLLPNDGYGAGYGQTETIDGNINNLRDLADYAHEKGVKIGLWTQSDLHPKEGVSALLQRDIVKEVRDAGVRVLKTDVAWVGAGYSFGLNGIADVSNIMTYYGNNSRPFIISLDGWAGTQRYASIWTGDQTGGLWEYIRFHIPTYLGSGLSGQPNISSDMDGIFGGKNAIVNIRDFQWKTFTPMQLNMDGWGANEKYPHALGEPATSINRWYLKLKSEIMPYAYSIAKESVKGLPMIRAMFLEFPNSYTLGKATQYQFLYGPYFLVAPICQDTKSDDEGNDIRNGIYLPEGSWIDYFSGEKFDGNRILNSVESPIWKLPVFVKNGAIIPMTNPNNNVAEMDNSARIYEVYPYGYSSFVEYDDDGITEEYKFGKGTTTLIESNVDTKNKVTITVNPAIGDFKGFIPEKSTELRINVTEKPTKIQAKIGSKKVKLTEVSSKDEFKRLNNVFYYDATPNLNQFSTKGTNFEKQVITKNPQLLVKIESSDISSNSVVVTFEGFVFDPKDNLRVTSGSLINPANAQVKNENTEAYTLKPTWDKVANADYYEIEFNDMLYSTIKETSLLFDGLEAEKTYSFKLRAVNKDGFSDWVSFDQTTKSNPLEFAIQGISAETTCENQGGSGIDKLFDFDESNMWHTKWGTNALPFDIIIDLKTINELDKFHFIPRQVGTNGNILKGTISYSLDKENWTKADSFEWANNSETKIFEFKNKPTSRYIKIAIDTAIGGFGAGQEMYIFKVPNTESYLPGDINNDGVIDRNDLTSYMNYTGLRRSDADFDYVSNGDINKNGLIDAYDISVVATQLDGGIKPRRDEKAKGKIKIVPNKQNYKKDEIVELAIWGEDLKSVNAISFAIPYNTDEYEYVGIDVSNMKKMTNLTYDRLHTNGTKSLYPTFVNEGDKETLEGSEILFVIKFKAKKSLRLNLKETDIIVVDKNLNQIKE